MVLDRTNSQILGHSRFAKYLRYCGQRILRDSIKQIDNLKIKRKGRKNAFFLIFFLFSKVDLNAFDGDTGRNKNPKWVTSVSSFQHRASVIATFSFKSLFVRYDVSRILHEQSSTHNFARLGVLPLTPPPPPQKKKTITDVSSVVFQPFRSPFA